MADRRDYYFRQMVTEDELDDGFAGVELADRDMVKDILGFGFLVSATNPATVVQNTPTPDLNVRVNRFVGYDQLGQRVTNLREAFKNGLPLGSFPQTLNMTTDEVGASTTVVTVGHEKTLAIFVQFERDLSDLRTDGNGSPVNFVREEAIKFNVVQSASAPVGTSVPPPLRTDQILLADVVIVQGQTQILNADIDQSRRQNFLMTLIHGANHVETGPDPVPNATPSVGGLLSGVDKTKLDAITFTAPGIGALFPTQVTVYRPADVAAPAAVSLDVTGTLTGLAAGGAPNKEGLVTQSQAPNNRVWLQNDDGDSFKDSFGNRIFGRVVVDNETTPTVYTLFFFVRDETSGEIAFNMTPFAGQAIEWFVPRAYRLHNLPTFDKDFLIPWDQMAGDMALASTTRAGKVLAALNSPPAGAQAGAFNVFQNNGTPLAGGPFHTINYVAGGATNPGPGVVQIPAVAGPPGGGGPPGPPGPPGPGFSSVSSAVSSGPINAAPSRTSSVSINTSINPIRMWQVTYTLEFLDATANDSVRIDSMSISSPNITVNYTTNDFDTTNHTVATFFGIAAG